MPALLRSERTVIRLDEIDSSTLGLFQPRKLNLLFKIYRNLNANRGGMTGEIKARLERWIVKPKNMKRLSRMFGPSLIDIRSSKVPMPLRLRTHNSQYSAITMPQFLRGYEPITLAILKYWLKSANCFYDIGSNWGYFSVSAAFFPEFNGEIHAFEPSPDSLKDLRWIVAELGLDDKIQIHPFGIGAQSGTYIMDTNCSSGRARIVDGASSRSVEIEVKSLDSIALTPPDVMKIDIEGFELNALEGAKKILQVSRPIVVFENHRDDDAVPIFDLLRSLDYVIYLPVFECRKGNQLFYVQENEWTHSFENYESKVVPVLLPIDTRERGFYEGNVNLVAVFKDRPLL